MSQSTGQFRYEEWIIRAYTTCASNDSSVNDVPKTETEQGHIDHKTLLGILRSEIVRVIMRQVNIPEHAASTGEVTAHQPTEQTKPKSWFDEAEVLHKSAPSIVATSPAGESTKLSISSSPIPITPSVSPQLQQKQQTALQRAGILTGKGPSGLVEGAVETKSRQPTTHLSGEALKTVAVTADLTIKQGTTYTEGRKLLALEYQKIRSAHPGHEKDQRALKLDNRLDRVVRSRINANVNYALAMPALVIMPRYALPPSLGVGTPTIRGFPSAGEFLSKEYGDLKATVSALQRCKGAFLDAFGVAVN